jgi:hypothetical protein
MGIHAHSLHLCLLAFVSCVLHATSAISPASHPPDSTSPSLANRARSLGQTVECRKKRRTPIILKEASRHALPTYPSHRPYPPYLPRRLLARSFQIALQSPGPTANLHRSRRSSLLTSVTLQPPFTLHLSSRPSLRSRSRHGNSTHFSTLFNTIRHRGRIFLVFLT